MLLAVQTDPEASHNIASMRKMKLTLKSTFFSLLGYVDTSAESSQPVQLEALRTAMLATLGVTGQECHAEVSRKLCYAHDVTALWYVRSELMGALACLHGERWAHHAMDELNTPFRALLPKGMSAGIDRRPH